MIRILQIIPSLKVESGITNVVLNWHRNIDKSKVQFDYLYFTESTVNYEKEIENLGGKCYKLPYPSFIKPWVFIKAVKKFFRYNKYNTIHSHVIHLSFFFYPFAKFYGVKNIIHHSHNIKWSDKFLNGLRNRFLFFWARIFITKKLACSDLAGKFLFKKHYKIINNGIDTEKFKFNEEIRSKIREELNIKDKFVIGHIGRFSHEKNHEFIIDIFNELYKQDKNSILLLVGDGQLKKEIEQKVYNLELGKNVIFTGNKKNVNDYYQSMDVFILPSFQEAFPVVGVEAQTSGLPCFFSNCMTTDIVICNSKQLSLDLSAKQWADEISKYKNFIRKDVSKIIRSKGFDISWCVKQIYSFYEIKT
jgi:glycosyltransferase involved in cell wall biosynthesis